MQHYKFLDIAADELRGTFASPAQSEQVLLYNAKPTAGWLGPYSAKYLLPEVLSLFFASSNANWLLTEFPAPEFVPVPFENIQMILWLYFF